MIQLNKIRRLSYKIIKDLNYVVIKEIIFTVNFLYKLYAQLKK